MKGGGDALPVNYYYYFLIRTNVIFESIAGKE